MNVNSQARCQFGLQSVENCEYRYNIKALRNDILVSNNFRDKKQIVSFVKYNDVMPVVGVVEVKGISFNLEPDINTTNSKFEEEKSLVGFVTVINFNVIMKNEDEISDIDTKKQYNKFSFVNLPNLDVWKYMNKFLRSNLIVKKKSQFFEHPSYKENSIIDTSAKFGDKVNGLSHTEVRVVTKRLVRSNLVDLIEKKFNMNEEDNLEENEVIEIEDSIFGNSIMRHEENMDKNKTIYRKNLLEKIILKEKNNLFIKLFYGFSILWLLASILLNSVMISKSYSYVSEFESELSYGRYALNMLSQTSSVAVNIFEIELVITNRMMTNSTNYAKYLYIQEKFKEVNGYLVNLVESSNIFSKKFSQQGMDNVFNYTYVIPPDLVKSSSKTNAPSKTSSRRLMDSNKNEDIDGDNNQNLTNILGITEINSSGLSNTSVLDNLMDQIQKVPSFDSSVSVF
jgi:hypothetical protein